MVIQSVSSEVCSTKSSCQFCLEFVVLFNVAFFSFICHYFNSEVPNALLHFYFMAVTFSPLHVSCLQIYHTFCCNVKLLVSQESETTKLIVIRNNSSGHIP